MEIKRRFFYEFELIFREVKEKVEEVFVRSERIDYIIFVLDGEFMFDINFGKEVEFLKFFEIFLVIFINFLFIWREDVREDFLKFDFVLLKVDVVSELFWRRIDRFYKSLSFEKIFEGMLEFRKEFKGKIVIEMMLIDGIDYGNEFEKIVEFLRELKLDKVYIVVLMRLLVELWVKFVKEDVINYVY